MREKTLSIYLEYMPGGSVRKILDRFGTFEEKMTSIYAAQMMKGLEFLHKNGVAHRDIKVFTLIMVLESIDYSTSISYIWLLEIIS